MNAREDLEARLLWFSMNLEEMLHVVATIRSALQDAPMSNEDAAIILRVLKGKDA